MSAFTKAEMAAIKNATKITPDGYRVGLVESVPALFSKHAHPKMSDKYAFTNTYEIVRYVMSLGYRVDSVQQTGSSNFAKLMVKMRAEKMYNTSGDSPQIVIVDSHDGTAALKFVGGWLRFVCMNGMIVGDHVTRTSIKHNSPTMESDIKLALMDVQEHLEHITSIVSKMRARIVSAQEMKQLAFSVSQQRFPDQPERFQQMASRELLTVRRSADMGSDLYTVMNRVQEGALRGGGGFIYEGRRVHIRPIEAIDRNISTNQVVWGEATKLLAA